MTISTDYGGAWSTGTSRGHQWEMLTVSYARALMASDFQVASARSSRHAAAVVVLIVMSSVRAPSCGT